jgi:hypothetical protein
VAANHKVEIPASNLKKENPRSYSIKVISWVTNLKTTPGFNQDCFEVW